MSFMQKRSPRISNPLVNPSGPPSPDVTVALTGVSATAAIGALAVAAVVAVSGVSATGNVGTPAVQHSQAVTGQQATGAVGSVGVTYDRALTGVAGTSTAGSLGSTHSQDLTGVAGTSAAGTVTPGSSLAITGVGATGSVGTVTESHGGTAALTGVAGVSAIGSVASTTAPPLVGVAGTSTVGSLGSTHTQSLTGVAGTSALGSVSPLHAQDVTGVSATSAVGTLSPSAVVPLTGVAGTGAVGNLTAQTGGNVTVQLSGVAGTGTVGTLSVDRTKALTGVAGTGAIGTVTPVSNLPFGPQAQGQQANTALGNLGVSVTKALTGVSATTAIGSVSPSVGYGAQLSGVAAVGAVGNLSPATSVPLTTFAWQQRSLQTFPFPGSFQVMYNLSGVLYTLAGESVYRSTDGGRNWTELSSNLPTSLFAPAGCVLNGKMFCIAGYDAGGGVLTSAVRTSTNGLVWTTIGNLPIELYGASAVVVGTDILVIGGRPLGADLAKVFKSTDEGLTWAEVGTNVLPTSIVFSSAGVLNGEVWIVGGESADLPGSGVSKKVIRGSGTTWTEVGSNILPDFLAGPTLAIIGDDFYATGLTGDPFSPAGQTPKTFVSHGGTSWSVLPILPFDGLTGYGAGTVLDGTIIYSVSGAVAELARMSATGSVGTLTPRLGGPAIDFSSASVEVTQDIYTVSVTQDEYTVTVAPLDYTVEYNG